MRNIWLLMLGILAVSSPSLGQSNSRDSQTLQSILTEIRLLRRDLRTVTVAEQRSQVLVHQMDAEETAVRAAQERVDATRSKLSQIHLEQQRRATTIKQIEDQKSNGEAADKEQAVLDDALSQIKARYDSLANEEQETQGTLAEQQEQLHIEQGRLSGIENQIDQLEQSLDRLDQGTQ